jgi:transitional endoplasmic reticulum ATPase
MVEKELGVGIQAGYLSDKGKGIARLDVNSMNYLDLSPGDIIEIQGKRRTYSKCLPRSEKGYDEGILNIDGLIRKNAGVEIGNRIYIKKILILEAEKIVIAPLEIMPLVEGDDIKETFVGTPFTKGDNIVFENLNEFLFFRVIETVPSINVVVATPKTVFQIEDYFFIKDEPTSSDDIEKRYNDEEITMEEFQQMKADF